MIIIEAAKEVGPSLFFALMVITVAFLPIFTLLGQEGRLFRPLAYAKTFAMLAASCLAITLTPALMTIFIKGHIRPEQDNPVNRLLQRIYDPVVRFCLGSPKKVLIGALILMGITAYPLFRLGYESMPALFEGALFYMPVTAPGVAISEVSSLLQKQDKILKRFPEVSQVFGKSGRAETATDPAPLEMFETIINLKPKSQWRKGMTVETLTMEMNEALTMTGVVNSFTSPIKARIDMLSTGIRTPLGMKIFGPNIEEIERIGIAVEKLLKDVPNTRSVYAERVNTGYFLDIAVNREKAARYGLTVDDVNEIIQSSVGGLNVTTTIEGRGRYPVNIRYARELRGDVDTLKRVLVPVSLPAGQPDLPAATAPGSAQVPLSQLADIRIVNGPTQIKSEAGMLTGYIYIDYAAGDAGTYIKECKETVGLFQGSRGLSNRMERRLRAHPEYPPTSQDRRTPYHPPDSHHPLCQHQVVCEDRYYPSRRPLLPGWLLLAPLPSRIPHEHRGLGRYHCPRRAGCGDRGSDAALPRSFLRPVEKGREVEGPFRPGGSRQAWCGKKAPAQDHDGRNHAHWPRSHPLQHRGRFGDHEEYRCTHDRRSGDVDRPRAHHLSRHLHTLEKKVAGPPKQQ